MAETTQGRIDSPRKLAETTHLPRPKRPTPKIGRNDPGRNDSGRNDPGPKRPGFFSIIYGDHDEFLLCRYTGMPLILRISTSGLQLAMIRLMNSPFLHYQQVSGSEIINIGKAGNHLPPWPQGQGGGFGYLYFQY